MKGSRGVEGSGACGNHVGGKNDITPKRAAERKSVGVTRKESQGLWWPSCIPFLLSFPHPGEPLHPASEKPPLSEAGLLPVWEPRVQRGVGCEEIPRAPATPGELTMKMRERERASECKCQDSKRMQGQGRVFYFILFF